MSPSKARKARGPAPRPRPGKPKAPADDERREVARPVTLAIDVGGSHIKAALLGASGHLVSDRLSLDTPDPLTPKGLLDTLLGVAESLDAHDRVSVGINGLVHGGRIYAIPVTADPAFRGFDLAGRFRRRDRRPVRILNDAQMHGLGFVRGRGVEMVITLGTGLGSALFIDGKLGPHVQFLSAAGSEDLRGGDYGDLACQSLGRKKWSRRVERLIDLLRRLTNFDHLYIGGGNARHLKLKLPRDVTSGDNSAALMGAVRMWDWDVE
ncbi:MAG TPA: ROK family protein [Vicinamibacteria bacterium]|jgi:polyphosphate glucokinase|nr:ROK family protein [Vicinamibacteria bacterium]